VASFVQLFTRSSAPYMVQEPWGGSRATFLWKYINANASIAAFPVPDWACKIRVFQGAFEHSSQLTIGTGQTPVAEIPVAPGTGQVFAAPGFLVPVGFGFQLQLEVEPGSTLYLQGLPPSSTDPEAGVLVSVEFSA
jgi:hypothetical protein